jgi:hypothetical protein
MVTFPSTSTKIGPVVIGVTFVLFVTASPFKVSLPNTLPAPTGVGPDANGAGVLMYRRQLRFDPLRLL